jgi:membrane-bound lytic murein transglycosylase B
MQFIPSTWAMWSTDGDADGRSDPNDLDDAAAATARYLCADGEGLTTAAGWASAVFSYNHAQAYVDEVHVAATTYAARAGS